MNKDTLFPNNQAAPLPSTMADGLRALGYSIDLARVMKMSESVIAQADSPDGAVIVKFRRFGPNAIEKNIAEASKQKRARRATTLVPEVLLATSLPYPCGIEVPIIIMEYKPGLTVEQKISRQGLG